ncbi:uncharacterized protein LOC143150682 [Ptiloglossa arizonensis]|uniref:uncharacterized protein LOC143150682 n=1 Tax=Ptiloglossa arizonensis TaxID=3350558 RepID=UPI003F9F9EE6
MDVFRREYNTYYSLLCITGLWPFDNSIFTNVQRVIFCLIPLSCIVVQVTYTQRTLNVHLTYTTYVTVNFYPAKFSISMLKYNGCFDCYVDLFFIKYSFVTCINLTYLLYMFFNVFGHSDNKNYVNSQLRIIKNSPNTVMFGLVFIDSRTFVKLFTVTRLSYSFALSISFSIITICNFCASFFSTNSFSCDCQLMNKLFQFTTLLMSEITLKNILLMITWSFPMILFVLRYVGIIFNFSTLRYVYSHIQTDCNTIKNPTEMEILMKYVKESRRVVRMFFRKMFNKYIYYSLCCPKKRARGYPNFESTFYSLILSMCRAIKLGTELVFNMLTKPTLQLILFDSYGSKWPGIPSDKNRLIQQLLQTLEVCLAGIVFVSTLLLVAILLDAVAPLDEPRSEYLRALGYIVHQQKYVNLVSVHVIMTTIIGMLTITCSESMLTVVAHYLCGLFKITSYRIQRAVNNAAKENTMSKQDVSNFGSIQKAVEMHKKTINIINTMISELMWSYLMAILMVVASFAVNMYRFFLAVVELTDILEIVFSGLVVFIHLVIMFLNNYSGQLILDDSVDVFYETYNSMWYCIPLRMQKQLLLIMHRSSIECAFNLSGLFVPCYQGFSTMVSTSFSYFTMLYSIQ